jgi:predicted unusual protein kinase regulating ubiquinone biosynthesis (AarF/ABC1/UbiB family)
MKLCTEHDIVFQNGFDKPINSGMISLVYLARYKSVTSNTSNTNNIVIKIKRKNIDQKLEEGINNLLFFINLLKIIPFFNNYKISETIQNNINVIKEQTNFVKEIANIQRVQNNCKNIDYIKIPIVYDNINNDYPNVIAMEHIDGKKFNELDKEDYLVFAKQVVKFGIITTVIHGFSHGDFHVGNILFIKEFNKNNNSPLYKLGIIDYGIMTEIREPFKSNILNCLTSVFQDTSIIFLDKFINSGIFEPCIIKNIMPEKIYNNLIESNLSFVDKLVHSKNLNQIFFHEIIKFLLGFLNSNLSKYGITMSDNFIKLQLSLAMSNGVTFALCQDKTMQLTNDVVNELFHTELFMDD